MKILCQLKKIGLFVLALNCVACSGAGSADGESGTTPTTSVSDVMYLTLSDQSADDSYSATLQIQNLGSGSREWVYNVNDESGASSGRSVRWSAPMENADDTELTNLLAAADLFNQTDVSESGCEQTRRLTAVSNDAESSHAIALAICNTDLNDPAVQAVVDKLESIVTIYQASLAQTPEVADLWVQDWQGTVAVDICAAADSAEQYVIFGIDESAAYYQYTKGNCTCLGDLSDEEWDDLSALLSDDSFTSAFDDECALSAPDDSSVPEYSLTMTDQQTEHSYFLCSQPEHLNEVDALMQSYLDEHLNQDQCEYFLPD